MIKTIVHEWGFQYLKLDFLFAACIRGGTHHNMDLTRAEVLKYGMKVIKEEAGNNVILSGCGMPISAGIGFIDIMRVGPDTAPVWTKLSGTFFQTGAMLGARNSIRNFLTRSLMNKTLWINDPDCIMMRKKKTKLNLYQRMTQINAIILAGGTLLYSDYFPEFDDNIFNEIKKIVALFEECFKGNAIPLDLMEKSIPELYYNTAGYLGIFNFKKFSCSKEIFLNNYTNLPENINKLADVWNNEEINVSNGYLKLKMHSDSSRLFKII